MPGSTHDRPTDLVRPPRGARSDDPHAPFDAILRSLTTPTAAKVGDEVLGAVLEELLVAGPLGRTRGDLFDSLTYSHNTVAKALVVLKSEDGAAVPLVTSGEWVPNRKGRPRDLYIIGSSHWATVGVHVSLRRGRAHCLTGTLQDLSGTEIRQLSREVDGLTVGANIADQIARLAADLVAGTGRRLLGVGVEVPGHVHQGKVLRADHVGYSAGDTHGAGDPIALADLISADLAELLPWPVPVVLENDVNLMALREIYRPGQERRPRDGAVVAVFDHGVGAGVLVSGRVHRGHSGAAGEIGHIPVLTGPLDPPRPGDPGAASGPARTGPARSRVAGFRDRCTCGLDSHVDCFATPERLTGELGRPLRDFAHAAAAPGHDADGALTPEGAAFWEGGTALGLGLVSLLHTVNPGWLLLMLPAALAEASPMDRVTAADLYRTAVETVLDRYAFSTTARDARAGDALRVSALSTGRTGRYMAARNASVRVVDEFVAHALGRDRCSRPPAPKAPAPAMTAVPGPDSRRKVEARKSRQLHHIMRRHDPEELVPAGVPRDEYLAEERQLLNLLDSRKITRDAVRELWEARFPQSRLLADEGRFDTFLRELVALQSHYPAANSA